MFGRWWRGVVGGGGVSFCSILPKPSKQIGLQKGPPSVRQRSAIERRFSGESMGAQWLSGRVLDSRPKGRGFESHRRHCVVVLEQDTFILA